jgi:hypothetical protein
MGPSVVYRPEARFRFLFARAEVGEHGGDRKSEAVENQVRDTNLKKSSETAAYLLGVLKRDHKDIAEDFRLVSKLPPKKYDNFET